MRTVIIFLLVAAGLCGQDPSSPRLTTGSGSGITDVRVDPPTPTQAIIRWTAPDNDPCTVEVSERPTYEPLINDLNPALFPGSQFDNRPGAVVDGRSRAFVVGTRDLQVASDGQTYSRSQQNDTTHYFRVTCKSEVAAGTYRTPPPNWGIATRDPMTLAGPGRLKAPSPFSSADQTRTDPYTGSLIKPLSLPGDQKANQGPYPFQRCALGTNWTNLSPCGALTGGSVTYTGSLQDLVGFAFNDSSWYRSFDSSPPDVDSVAFEFDGNCTGQDCSQDAARMGQVCLSYEVDAGICGSPWIDVSLPNSIEQRIKVCNSSGGPICDIWGAPYKGWGSVSFGAGLVYTSGYSTTLNFTDAADCNRLQVGEQFSIRSGRDTTISAKNCGATPPSITTASPMALDPAGTGVAGWPFQYYSGFGYNPRFGVLFRKKSTTHPNAALSVKNPKLTIGRSGSWGFTSAGHHQRCDPNLTSHGNILCKPGGTDLFSVDPVSGARHYLGVVVTAGVPLLQNGRRGETSGPGAVLWDNDGVSLYGSFEAAADERNHLLARYTFTGDDRVDNVPAEAQQIAYASGSFTVMNPAYLNDLAQACSDAGIVCEKGFDKAKFNCGAEGFLVYRYVVISCQGQQDTYSWPFIYDLGNKLPVGAGGDGKMIAGFPLYRAGSITAWGVTHNVNNPHDVAAAMVGVKQPNDEVPGNNKFYVTLAADVSATDTTFQVASQWNTAWGRQPAGFTPGDPVSDALPGGQHWLQALAEGDMWRVDDPFEHTEYIRIVKKRSPTILTVQRGMVFECTPCSSYAYKAGQRLYMYPHTGCFEAALGARCGGHTGAYWDFLASPKGDDPAKFYNTFLPGGGHTVTLNQYNLGTPSPLGVHLTPGGVLASPGAFPMIPANQDFTQQQDVPFFAGKYAPHIGAMGEGHPSMNPVSARNRRLLVDVHPFIGAGFMSGSISRVSGMLYRIDNFAEGGRFPDGLSRKHFPTLASCGTRPLEDVSGPARLLRDGAADQYRYCVPNADGECAPGSKVGEIYFNCPNVAPDKRGCTALSQDPTDVCFGDFAAKMGHHVIYELPQSADDATRLRDKGFFVLLSGLITKGAANTANAKMLPGNNWVLTGAGGPPSDQRVENVLVKVPALAEYDNIDRSTFVPVSVPAGPAPAGATNIIVEFGYAEYGASTDFYCTSRRESCLSAGTTIDEANPFYFASESYSGFACSSSCTTVIPGISGRVVYFRTKYRDGSDAVLTTGPLQVAAVP